MFMSIVYVLRNLWNDEPQICHIASIPTNDKTWIYWDSLGHSKYMVACGPVYKETASVV